MLAIYLALSALALILLCAVFLAGHWFERESREATGAAIFCSGVALAVALLCAAAGAWLAT